jgi:DNA-binding NtrC family response regulator
MARKEGDMSEYKRDHFVQPSEKMVRPRISLPSSDCLTGKILLVENDDAQRLLYREELEEEGYEVILAKNGKEALKCLEESLCDLAVLDILMPEMDGLEALGKIAARYGKMPIILHTAYPRYKSEFISWLADAFLVKSSDLSLLKNTIKELLEKNQNRKEQRRRESKTT